MSPKKTRSIDCCMKMWPWMQAPAWPAARRCGALCLPRQTIYPGCQSPRHPSSCPWICLLCPAGAPSHLMICFQMPQMSQSRRNAPKRCLRERLCSHISRVIKSARALSKERQVCGRTRLWRLWPLRLRLSHRRRHAPAPALALTVALVLPLSLALALTPLPA